MNLKKIYFMITFTANGTYPNIVAKITKKWKKCWATFELFSNLSLK